MRCARDGWMGRLRIVIGGVKQQAGRLCGERTPRGFSAKLSLDSSLAHPTRQKSIERRILIHITCSVTGCQGEWLDTEYRDQCTHPKQNMFFQLKSLSARDYRTQTTNKRSLMT